MSIPEDLRRDCGSCNGTGFVIEPAYRDTPAYQTDYICGSCDHGKVWTMSQQQMAERIFTLTAQLDAAKAENDRLRAALEMFYDRWENGTPCTEANEDGDCTDGSPIGNAVKLSFAEEQEILNLIVDKAEDGEQACANCGKPYRAHLLQDATRCSPEGDAKWFPQAIADGLLAARKEHGNGSPPAPRSKA